MRKFPPQDTKCANKIRISVLWCWELAEDAYKVEKTDSFWLFPLSFWLFTFLKLMTLVTDLDTSALPALVLFNQPHAQNFQFCRLVKSVMEDEFRQLRVDLDSWETSSENSMVRRWKSKLGGRIQLFLWECLKKCKTSHDCDYPVIVNMILMVRTQKVSLKGFCYVDMLRD